MLSSMKTTASSPRIARGYATAGADQPLRPFTFERRSPNDEDVVIDIAYCGVCHLDVHAAHNAWGMSHYPMVPGHEITGVVREVGKAVARFKKGDRVGIGCFIDSCDAGPPRPRSRALPAWPRAHLQRLRARLEGADPRRLLRLDRGQGRLRAVGAGGAAARRRRAAPLCGCHGVLAAAQVAGRSGREGRHRRARRARSRGREDGSRDGGRGHGPLPHAQEARRRPEARGQGRLRDGEPGHLRRPRERL